MQSYCEVRWTSFANSLIILFETKDFIKDFLEKKEILSSGQFKYLYELQDICKTFKFVIETYENDSFGASGCFLADISLIKRKLADLENTDFGPAVTATKKKINKMSKKNCYFWESIAPVALLFNPHIVKYGLLLTTEQIESAKEKIRAKMKRYPPYVPKDKSEATNNQSPRNKMFGNNEQPDDSNFNDPLLDLLVKRNSSIPDLYQYWFQKIETDEKQLAMVAIEVLGMVVTSVSSERSFSTSRYIISDYRTNLSSEHACDQLTIRCNRKIAVECLDKIDIFQKINEKKYF